MGMGIGKRHVRQNYIDCASFFCSIFRPDLYMNALLTLLEDSCLKCNIREETFSYYISLIKYIQTYYKKYWSSTEIKQKEPTIKLNEKMLRTVEGMKRNFTKLYDWSTMDTKVMFQEIKVCYLLLKVKLLM